MGLHSGQILRYAQDEIFTEFDIMTIRVRKMRWEDVAQVRAIDLI